MMMTVARTPSEAASAHILEMITRKRSRKRLSAVDIGQLIENFVAGKIPDYQMSAWLATVASIGMDIEEIEALTRAYMGGYAHVSHAGLGRKVVDKHSTGGVGDKVSFVVVPIVAACGVPVTKISGRGLEHAGGTLDKLESIAGLKLDLGAHEVRAILNEVGMVITGQSDELVPGDRATYSLRNASGSVESIALIAASIISKKIATGADGLVLDVKTGSGALIQPYEESVALAETMLELAKRFGIQCFAVVSDMSQPLGYAVGHTLEIKEALAVLQGAHIPGLTELCCVIARLMLQVTDRNLSNQAADERINRAIAQGTAYERFLRWARVQGADTRQLRHPELFPSARYQKTIFARQSGWVQSIDPRAIGYAALRLGTRPELDGSVADHSAGIILRKRVGDPVVAGEALAELHYNSDNIREMEAVIDSAFELGASSLPTAPLIHRVIES